MDRIVAIGDVRGHGLYATMPRDYENQPLMVRGALREKSTCCNRNFYGGAALLVQAIRRAFSGLKEPPDIIGYDAEDFQEFQKRSVRFDTYWDLTETILDGHTERTLRLMLPEATEPRPPYNEIDLISSLVPMPLKVQRWIKDDPRPPHLLLIDDLSLCLRSLPIVAGDADLQKELKDRELDSKEVSAYCLQLQAIFESLKFPPKKASAATNSVARPHPSLEPIICVSVTGPMPDFQKAEAAKNFWHRLYVDQTLSDRTVVILDADDLRNEGIGISTSLSWEKTAQDTIAEINRNPRLSCFLRFRHLIVRYGATGALHCNFTQTHPQYTLYFDPSHEDSDWQGLEDGQILGYNDVYAGTLAQKMHQACLEYGRASLLTDLDEVIGPAVAAGVARCQYLCAFGYGREIKLVINPTPAQGFGIRLFPDDLFHDFVTSHPNLKHPPLVAEALVQISSSHAWSILDESMRTAGTKKKTGDVAAMIARYGLQSTMNQPKWNPEQICRALWDSINTALSHALEKERSRIDAVMEDVKRTLVKSDVAFGRLPLTKRQELIGIRETTDTVLIRDVWKGIQPEVAKFLQRVTYAKAAPYLCDWNLDQLLEERVTKVANARIRLKLKKVQSDFAKLKKFITRTLKQKLDGDLNAKSRFDVWAAPFARFGDPGKGNRDRRMIFLDRQEIEGVRTIRNLIKGHLKAVGERKNKRPLSVAVFGPPGAGKSSAVKAIVSTLKLRIEAGNLETTELSCNLSQYTDVSQLEKDFESITAAIALRKVPIVFFDEFDCKYQQDELGWLKFFLSPMEDGKYRGKTVKDAVFVFAGGISKNFSVFSQKGIEETTESYKNFSTAKGPDFTSRLQGHMNIMGINRNSTLKQPDELYLIRRGLFLRSQFADMQDLQNFEESRVDKDVLRALLLVPEYKHGGRSMRMVLELCAGADNHIGKSTMPTIDQIDMHVDGMAFMDLIAGASTSDG